MSTSLRAALLLASPIVMVASAHAQAVDPARTTVETLNEGLVSIMKAGGSPQRRGAMIAPVLDRTFDLAMMTRLSVGPSWTTMTPADQTGLVAAFRRMTIAQYARNFDHFGGERFNVDPQVQERGGDKLVRTTLVAPREQPVAISYRLRQSGGSWKIVDVFYKNAISQIATRRSDFASVLQRQGARGLISHLDSLAAKGG
ncbi:ABC transporter substrate-binding protein [Novosphingobium nitrogenifigens]|uniref:ABC transporter substrate-binding protein n=1 Tax=Novosphingobium nitrogenifigens TaxID=378548 RepID=UPI0003050332|nr:ABC transporter substrate-binding protein [Novosphingobium nitrogenifigens]